MLTKIILSLLFYAYALLAAPWFGIKLRGALESGEAVILPGLLLLFALVGETVALPWKFRGWPADENKDSGVPLKLGAGICITHVILAYFLGIYLLDAFGFMGRETTGNQSSAWPAVTFILLFFREGYLFFAAAVARRQPKPVSRIQAISADILLLCFQCIAYTAYWDVMMAIGPVPGLTWIAWIVLSPALILLFYIVYLPIRMTDILGIYYTEGPSSGRRAAVGMVLSGAILGLYPIARPALITLLSGR